MSQPEGSEGTNGDGESLPAGGAGGRADIGRQAVTILTFGITLGASGLVLPLAALDSGFGIGAVGAFTAVSAGAQFGVRLFLPALLERISDRTLMAIAGAHLALSFGLLLVLDNAAGFVAAQALQGAARALFWTASQSHAIRAPGSDTRRLAFVQMLGTSGGLIGPVVGGFAVSVSLATGITAGVVVSLTAAAAALTLRHDPPYQREPGHAPIWKLEGIGLAAWAGSIGGAWRGVLDSFVPAVLASAGVTAAAVGWLIALADGAAFVATAAVARWSVEAHLGPAVALAGVAAAGAIVAVPFMTHPAVAAPLLVVGGVGGGLGLVLAPAVATRVATGGERGAGIALAGTYRAGARLALPATVSALTAVMPLAAALPAVGLGLLAPLPMVRRRSGRRTRPPQRESDDMGLR